MTIQFIGYMLALWVGLSVVVGLITGAILAKVEHPFDVFNDYYFMDNLEQLTNEELQSMLDSKQFNMEESLAIRDELQSRKGKTERPSDSQFECFGCGS